MFDNWKWLEDFERLIWGMRKHSASRFYNLDESQLERASEWLDGDKGLVMGKAISLPERPSLPQHQN